MANSCEYAFSPKSGYILPSYNFTRSPSLSNVEEINWKSQQGKNCTCAFSTIKKSFQPTMYCNHKNVILKTSLAIWIYRMEFWNFPSMLTDSWINVIPGWIWLHFFNQFRASLLITLLFGFVHCSEFNLHYWSVNKKYAIALVDN